MAKLFPGLTVYGADSRVDAITKTLDHLEVFNIGNITVIPLKTSGHTTGSVCYFMYDNVDKVVFTGDTLFIGGCGRFFEGTAMDMVRSMCLLGSLHPNTKVYCGHEYTASNYKFAQSIEPDNIRLKEKASPTTLPKRTVPSTIDTELATNPFMRVDRKIPAILKAVGGDTEDPVEIMHRLRQMKNNFK